MGDEAASRDDQGLEDQAAASVSSADSGSIVFEMQQSFEDQEVKLKSSRTDESSHPSDMEGSIVFEKELECEDQKKERLKSIFPDDTDLEASIDFQKEQEREDEEKVRLKSLLLDDSEVSLDVTDLIAPSNGDDVSDKDKENDKDAQEGDSSDQDGSETSEEKDESPIWKFRHFCGFIVNNDYVQIFIIVLIVMNALIMGLATFDFVTDDPEVNETFEIVDRAFLVVFTAEVSLQFFYLGFTLFTDGWLTFDFIIVVLSWSVESLQIIRAFRIFRAFRLVTRIKPLRDLILAIGAVMPRMYAIGALLLLIFYIFSVLFTELFKDLPLSDDFFGSLGQSLFTCMQLMTLGWGDIVREVMVFKSWAWAPFCAFISLTGFIVFNLIVAVVCDAVAVTEKTVRQLDGIESDDPLVKIDEAQERIDLIQCHIEDMLRTQQAVQDMIEIMAGELLYLEVERTRSDQRDVELRIELERRKDFEKSMQSDHQLEGLQKTTNVEKERRAQNRLNESNGSLVHTNSPHRSRRTLMTRGNSRATESERSLKSRNSRGTGTGSDVSGAASRRNDVNGDSIRSINGNSIRSINLSDD